MSTSEPTPQPADSITTRQDPFGLPPPTGSPWPDEDHPPPRLARPFPLHPNFWWAILWCFGLVIFTQIPAGLVAVGVILVLAFANPDAVKDVSSPAFGIGVTVGIVLAHALIILFSLAVLRIVAGRDWARQVALRPPALWHLLLTVAIMPAFVLMGSLLDILLRDVLHFPSVSNPADVASFWAAVALALLVIGIGQVLCRVIGGRDWYRDRIEPLAIEVKWLLSVGLLGLFLGLSVGGYFLMQWLTAGMLPTSAPMTGMEDMMKMLLEMPLIAAVIVIAVFPGVSEELWCRAFLGRGLVGKYGLFWGVLLTSFLFGAIHLDTRQGTMAVFMGVALHLVYLASRSLFVPMLLHFLNNALAVTLARVPEIVALEKAPREIPVHLYAAGALLLGVCLFAFWLTRARLVGLWQPEYPGVACPPPESETRVTVPWPSWLLVAIVATAVLAFAASLWLAIPPR